MEHLRLRMAELEKYVNALLEKIHEIADKVDQHENIIIQMVEEINKVTGD